MSFGVVVGHISAKIVAIAKNTSKMAFFAKKSDFVEYSTGVEYSEGHKKIFLSPTYDKVFPKKFSCQSDQNW